MSLSLLATSLLQRCRISARKSFESVAPAPPRPEAPHRLRARLRQQVLSLSGTLAEIETIRGDCPAQTAQQIADLSAWLAQRNVSCE
jgi:hypothetical protein